MQTGHTHGRGFWKSARSNSDRCGRWGKEAVPGRGSLNGTIGRGGGPAPSHALQTGQHQAAAGGSQGPIKGKPYPETVLLRLITADGRPNVKLGAGKSGSGLLIGGEDDPNYVQALAEGDEPRVKLSNGDGRERVIEP